MTETLFDLQPTPAAETRPDPAVRMAWGSHYEAAWFPPVELAQPGTFGPRLHGVILWVRHDKEAAAYVARLIPADRAADGRGGTGFDQHEAVEWKVADAGGRYSKKRHGEAAWAAIDQVPGVVERTGGPLAARWPHARPVTA